MKVSGSLQIQAKRVIGGNAWQKEFTGDSSSPSECLCVTRRTDFSPNEHDDAIKTFHICSYPDKGCIHASKLGMYQIRHDLKNQEFSLILGLHKIHPKPPTQRCRWWMHIGPVTCTPKPALFGKTRSPWQRVTKCRISPISSGFVWQLSHMRILKITFFLNKFSICKR